MRSAFMTFLLGAYVIVLLVMLLAPFDWYTRNGAVLIPDADGITFTRPGIVRTASPPARLHAELTSGSGFTAEVWFTSHSAAQSGPARIVSYSASTRSRNFTLGQQGNALVVRLRTSRTNENGMPELEIPEALVPGRKQHVVVTYDLRLLCVHVDARQRTCTNTPGGDLSGWDPSHHLLLGNEATGTRPWLGSIFVVALYHGALENEVIERAASVEPSTAGSPAPMTPRGLVALYRFAERTGRTIADSSPRPPIDLTIPTTVEPHRPFLTAKSPLLSGPPTPYVIFDAALNLTIFVPFGLLSCRLLAARGGHPATSSIIVVAATAAMSLGAESLQFFMMSRSSEQQDVVLNTISGALGAALYWLATTRHRRAVSGV